MPISSAFASVAHRWDPMKHQHALSINRYSAYKQGRLTSVENLAVHPRIQAIGGLSECRIGPGNFETLLSQARLITAPPKRRSSQTARSSLLMAVFWQRFSPRDALSDQLRQVYSTGGLAKNVTVFAPEFIGRQTVRPHAVATPLAERSRTERKSCRCRSFYAVP